MGTMTMMAVEFDGEDVPDEMLPKAAGWRVIVAPIHVSNRTAGGIYKSDSEVQAQEHMRFVGKVMSVGPLAFKGDKFREDPKANAQPWCKVGDIISTSQYAGSTLPCRHNNKQFYFRMINDEEIVTVIPDLSILDI